MADYSLSPRAEEDLRQIWRRIAPDNEPAADALLRRLLDKAALAASYPLMGVQRPELSPTARLLIEGRYIMIYEPVDGGIYIVAIVAGERDEKNWLE